MAPASVVGSTGIAVVEAATVLGAIAVAAAAALYAVLTTATVLTAVSQRPGRLCKGSHLNLR